MALEFNVVTRSMDNDRRVWGIIKRLVQETGRKHIAKYGIVLVLSALIAWTTAAITFLLRDTINGVFVDKNLTALYTVSASVFVVFTIRGFSSFGQLVLLSQISNAIILELQVKLFGRVLAKEPSFFSGSSSGEMMTLINQGASSAKDLLNIIVTTVGRDIFSLIALIATLFIMNWAMALSILLAVPVIVIIVSNITKRVRSISREKMEVSISLSNKIRSNIQGIKVVKAFAAEEKMEEAMYKNGLSLLKLSNKQAVVTSRLVPFMEMTAGILIAAFIAIGGTHVIESGQTPGELIAFVFAALMVYDPARRLSNARTKIESALVGVRMMYRFLDAEQELLKSHDSANKPALNVKQGVVAFKNINFHYKENEPVLKGIHFTAELGKLTALVGRSGAGKTTIANLLLRFWEPTTGEILIDSQSITDYSVKSLRENLAYVGQDSFMFDGSIRDNIILGRPEASLEEIITAAKAAEAHRFIEKLPQGYDSPVGELGSNLSGGQRQRLAIARALLRKSPIFLLDEPTSALDGETERAIQRSLAQISQQATTLIIAHRLSTVQNADQILVVDGGRIVEQGRHEDLMALNGHYTRLFGEDLEES